MLIGIDARFYGPIGGGGLGRYTKNLIDYLEKTDHKNEYVIFLCNENWEDYNPSRPNFKKVLAPYKWYSFKEQLLMPIKIWKQKVDLMHFPHFNVPLLYTRINANVNTNERERGTNQRERGCNRGFILTIHDLILLKYPSKKATTLCPLYFKLKYLMYKIVIASAVKRAKKIITPSQFVKDDILKHFKVHSDKIFVIYEGVADMKSSNGFGASEFNEDVDKKADKKIKMCYNKSQENKKTKKQKNKEDGEEGEDGEHVESARHSEPAGDRVSPKALAVAQESRELAQGIKRSFACWLRMTQRRELPPIRPSNTAGRRAGRMTRGNGKYILYVGNAYPHKNLEMLVEAFNIVSRKYFNTPPYPPLIKGGSEQISIREVGERTTSPLDKGGSRGALKKNTLSYLLVLVGVKNYFYQQLIKYVQDNHSGLESRIIFFGYATDQELRQLYENAELYVFPSLQEGFGLPPLEAMSYGVPVVSSKCSCLPEVLGSAALYFDAGNVKDMAEKIYRGLMDIELRKDLIKNGYDRIKLYDWEKMARETRRIYDCRF